MTPIERVFATAHALVRQLDLIQQDISWTDVLVSAARSGVEYTGPAFGTQLEDLRSALASTPRRFPDELSIEEVRALRRASIGKLCSQCRGKRTVEAVGSADDPLTIECPGCGGVGIPDAEFVECPACENQTITLQKGDAAAYRFKPI